MAANKQLPYMQRFRARVKVKAGNYKKVQDFLGRINSFARDVEAFEQANRQVSSKAQITAANKEIDSFIGQIYVFGREGNNLYDGFEPITAKQARNASSWGSYPRLNPVERGEYKLHKCLRELKSLSINLRRQKPSV